MVDVEECGPATDSQWIRHTPGDCLVYESAPLLLNPQFVRLVGQRSVVRAHRAEQVGETIIVDVAPGTAMTVVADLAAGRPGDEPAFEHVGEVTAAVVAEQAGPSRHVVRGHEQSCRPSLS